MTYAMRQRALFAATWVAVGGCATVGEEPRPGESIWVATPQSSEPATAQGDGGQAATDAESPTPEVATPEDAGSSSDEMPGTSQQDGGAASGDGNGDSPGNDTNDSAADDGGSSGGDGSGGTSGGTSGDDGGATGGDSNGSTNGGASGNATGDTSGDTTGQTNGTPEGACPAGACADATASDASECSSAITAGRTSLLAGTFSHDGDTNNDGNDQHFYPDISCLDAHSDNFFRMYLLSGERLDVQLDVHDALYRASLKFYRAPANCGSPSSAAVQCRSLGSSQQASWSRTADTDGWYHVVVDGQYGRIPDEDTGGGDDGPYTLRLELTPSTDTCTCQ